MLPEVNRMVGCHPKNGVPEIATDQHLSGMKVSNEWTVEHLLGKCKGEVIL